MLTRFKRPYDSQCFLIFSPKIFELRFQRPVSKIMLKPKPMTEQWQILLFFFSFVFNMMNEIAIFFYCPYSFKNRVHVSQNYLLLMNVFCACFVRQVNPKKRTICVVKIHTNIFFFSLLFLLYFQFDIKWNRW